MHLCLRIWVDQHRWPRNYSWSFCSCVSLYFVMWCQRSSPCRAHRQKMTPTHTLPQAVLNDKRRSLVSYKQGLDPALLLRSSAASSRCFVLLSCPQAPLYKWSGWRAPQTCWGSSEIAAWWPHRARVGSKRGWVMPHVTLPPLYFRSRVGREMVLGEGEDFLQKRLWRDVTFSSCSLKDEEWGLDLQWDSTSLK